MTHRASSTPATPLFRVKAHRFTPARNPARVYLARMGTEQSRRTMRAALTRIAAIASGGTVDYLAFPWHRLSYERTAQIRDAMARGLAASTVNQRLAALRGVLREAWKLRLMSAEEYGLAAELERVRAVPPLRGRALGAQEIRRLLEACAQDGSPAGARDAAILALLYGAALRRAEVVALQVDDWAPTERELRVRGKGRRSRSVPLPTVAHVALEAWIARRDTSPGPLFQPVSRAGRLLGRRMGACSVYDVVERRATQAGVADCSPHDLRRTASTDLLDAGVDLAVVSKYLGHSKLETTARYDRRGARALRAAADAIRIPGADRTIRRGCKSKRPRALSSKRLRSQPLADAPAGAARGGRRCRP